MKKNLLTVLVLALVLVNVILTAVMMFSVMSTNRKTAALVDNVAAILNLELEQPGEEEEEKVSMADLAFWNLSDKMTIPLLSDDGKNHYIVFEVAFSMNTKAKGYKKYGEDVAAGTYESVVKDVITNTVNKYTVADCTNRFDTIKAEILKNVQDLFDQEFIHSVAISGMQIQ